MTRQKWVQQISSRPFDKTGRFEGIRKGMRHLHSLGLIHNDISPYNVMVTEDDAPVLIDFDSCRDEGRKFGMKAETMGWTDEAPEIAV